jgi:hypothetical protein
MLCVLSVQTDNAIYQKLGAHIKNRKDESINNKEKEDLLCKNIGSSARKKRVSRKRMSLGNIADMEFVFPP